MTNDMEYINSHHLMGRLKLKQLSYADKEMIVEVYPVLHHHLTV